MTKKQTAEKDKISFVVVGHVDHGKSSLIGRLLVDTKTAHQEQIDAVKRICKERGKPFEYAFLLDAFQEERDQGITIDTTKIEFSTKKRQYTIIDAPGHKEFLKNMVSGASRAEAAILIVDASQGMQEQTRKHAYLLSLLGISQVSVVINKMDLVDYSKELFVDVKEQVIAYLKQINVTPKNVIPISAIAGDNIISKSENMSWYIDKTIIEAIDTFENQGTQKDGLLRLPLQDIYKFDQRRILAGRIESGTINVGDSIIAYPSKKTAKVKSLESWPKKSTAKTASAGQCVGITIDDEFFLERGEIITRESEKPLISTLLEVTVFWMGKESLQMGKEYTLKIHTKQTSCKLHAINTVVSSETLDAKKHTGSLDRYEVGQVVLQTKEPIVFDTFGSIPATGRFVLVDGFDVAGGGIIRQIPEIMRQRESIKPKSMLISPKETLIKRSEREKRNKHKGHVVWITGLSGSGKNLIAQHLERVLFDANINAYYLDSSNVRLTLSGDLSFSEKQRKEHSRRMAELANYLLHAGMVVIVSIISPYKQDRAYARKLIGDKNFTEVFVDTPIEICKQNNPHGIYAKVEKGEIKGVPGVDIAYEASDNPSETITITKKDFDPLSISKKLGESISKNVKIN